MRIPKLFKGITAITALSLIYIYMQMQIFALAYQATKSEQFIRELSEDQGNLTYHILKLKSSYNLGYQLLSENSNMKFRDNSQIVRLPLSQPEGRPTTVALSLEKKTNPILSFFSLKSQAEAKPQE